VHILSNYYVCLYIKFWGERFTIWCSFD
jgi:hypothetical protein